MAKRRSTEEPLLFDLPLREAEEDDGVDLLRPTPPRKSRPAPEPERADVVEEELDGDESDDGEDADPAAGRPPAPVVDRLLAGLTDLAIQALTSGGAIAGVMAMGQRLGRDDWPPFAVFALVFSFLYWVIPLAFWGQTPGMTWIGQLARSESEEPLAFSQTVRRWLGALLTLALAGLPLLLAAFGGRSLSDRLSGSKTVSL